MERKRKVQVITYREIAKKTGDDIQYISSKIATVDAWVGSGLVGLVFTKGMTQI
jgi:hypothetical protein